MLYVYRIPFWQGLFLLVSFLFGHWKSLEKSQGGTGAQVDRISAAAKHLGIDGDVVPFGSYTNTLPGSSAGPWLMIAWGL